MDFKKWSNDYEWIRKFMNEISQNSSSSKKIETNERNFCKSCNFYKSKKEKNNFSENNYDRYYICTKLG